MSEATSDGATAPISKQQIYQLPIVFTGSGSEYFRIWLVNLLLTLVTLGIYYPWAKVRRLRYFYGNTLVGGEPLDFHADPKRMLRGYALVALLLAAYVWAGQMASSAGVIAFLILVAILPALLRTSMQFRLANTSWRGLRFRFTGSMAGAYQTLLPLFVPVIILLVLSWLRSNVSFFSDPPLWFTLSIMLGILLIMMLLVPWLFWNLKRYQHNHYALASLQTHFKAGPGAFYGLLAKVAGLTFVMAIILGAVVAIVMVVFFRPSLHDLLDPDTSIHGMAIVAVVVVYALLLMLTIVQRTYLISRLQNLVWSNTSNASIRFLSKLSFKSLFKLTSKNWLFMILTLGLHWPFAAIATARLRLEAMRVQSRIHPDELVGELRSKVNDATGDAAGDLFDLDIGF